MEIDTLEQAKILSNKEKIDLMRYSISRFDGYYQSINSKIALYITISTFILTAITAGGPAIINQLDHNKNIPILFLTLTAISTAVAIFFTIKASIPYLKNNRASIFYYGYVTELSTDDYKQKISTLNVEMALEDLTCQAHLLAKGLKNKYLLLQIAGYLLLVDFTFIILLSLLIITKQ